MNTFSQRETSKADSRRCEFVFAIATAVFERHFLTVFRKWQKPLRHFRFPASCCVLRSVYMLHPQLLSTFLQLVSRLYFIIRNIALIFTPICISNLKAHYVGYLRFMYNNKTMHPPLQVTKVKTSKYLSELYNLCVYVQINLSTTFPSSESTKVDDPLGRSNSKPPPSHSRSSCDSLSTTADTDVPTDSIVCRLARTHTWSPNYIARLSKSFLFTSEGLWFRQFTRPGFSPIRVTQIEIEELVLLRRC